jgi:hypothetical protein
MDGLWARKDGGNGLVDEQGLRAPLSGGLGWESRMRSRWNDWLRKLDVYPKTVEDVRLRSVTGGIIALFSYICIGILVVSEFLRWLQPQLHSNVLVDARSILDTEPITVDLGIDLLAVGCDEFSLDALTANGAQLPNSVVELRKRPLDASGQPVIFPRGAFGRSRLRNERGGVAPAPQALTEDPPNTQQLEGRVSQEVRAQLKQYREEAIAFRDRLAALNKTGVAYCGSCYGAVPQTDQVGEANQITSGVCCNTCDEIRVLYEERNWAFDQVLRTAEQCAEKRYLTLLHEAGRVQSGGCRVSARLQLPRVAGNFHFAPGKGHTHRMGHHVHSVDDQLLHRTYNFSHRIRHLRFGPLFPHQQNPLDGAIRILEQPPPGSPFGNMVLYYCKLIPTTYRRDRQRGDALRSMEYAAADLTQSSEQDRVGITHSTGALPGIFFFYEPQPLQIAYFEGRMYGLLHFIVQLCAIVGGVFTVSSMIDRFVFGAGTFIRAQKRRLGKLG